MAISYRQDIQFRNGKQVPPANSAVIKGVARSGASGGAGAMGPRKAGTSTGGAQLGPRDGMTNPVSRRADIPPAQAMGPRNWKEEFMADPLGSLDGESGGVGGMRGYGSGGSGPGVGRLTNTARIAGVPRSSAEGYGGSSTGQDGPRSGYGVMAEMAPRSGYGAPQPQMQPKGYGQQLGPSAHGTGSPGMWGYADPGVSMGGGYQASPWQNVQPQVRPRAGRGFLQDALRIAGRGR